MKRSGMHSSMQKQGRLFRLGTVMGVTASARMRQAGIRKRDQYRRSLLLHLVEQRVGRSEELMRMFEFSRQPRKWGR
jgi:hypothetical protein